MLKLGVAIALTTTLVLGLECNLDSVSDDFEEALQLLRDEGYITEKHKMDWSLGTSNYVFCNPNTYYGMSKFAPFKGLEASPMRGSDALLFVGCTPPKARYFAENAYLGVRITGNPLLGEWNELTSTMTDSLNNLIINTRGSNAFDALTSVITTGDETTFNDISNALDTAGLADIINSDPIIPDFKWGVSPILAKNPAEVVTPYDLVSVLWRLVNPESEDEMKAFMELSDSFHFYLIKAPFIDNVQPRVPMPIAEPRNPKNGYSEETVFGCLYDGVIDDTIAHFTDLGYTYVETIQLIDDTVVTLDLSSVDKPDFEVAMQIWGDACIHTETDCLMDNRDTYYAVAPNISYIEDDDFYLFFGLDHSNISPAKSLYSSHVVYYVVDRSDDLFTPVASAQNNAMEQSPISESGVQWNATKQCGAAHYNRSDNVIVTQVTRADNCVSGFNEICLDDSLLKVSEPIVFFGRAHLNPNTATHPDTEQLLPFKVVHLKVPISDSQSTKKTALASRLDHT